MTLDQYMVIGQRVRQQILTHDRCRLDPDLCTAHVLLVLTTRHFHVHGQQTLQVMTQLNQRIVACPSGKIRAGLPMNAG